ncbi:MAG: hypothetical protein WBM72_15165 [Actinomycetota bacterium]
MDERENAWVDLGLSHRLWFTQDDPYDTASLSFELCARGDGAIVRNVVCGPWAGTELRAFDLNVWEQQQGSDPKGQVMSEEVESAGWEAILSNQKRSVTERWECAVMRVGAECVRSSVAPRGVLSGVTDVLTLRDFPDRLVDFEWEDFNRAFEVRTTDRRFINDILDARMLALLHGRAQGCVVEFVGNRAMVARPITDPPDVAGLVDLGADLIAAVLRVVRELYPALPGAPLTPRCPMKPDGSVQMPEVVEPYHPYAADNLDPGGWAPRRPS